MDEKLKNQLLISVLPAGLVFMGYQFGFNLSSPTAMGFMMAFLLAAIAGGITFGIVYFIQKDQ